MSASTDLLRGLARDRDSRIALVVLALYVLAALLAWAGVGQGAAHALSGAQHAGPSAEHWLGTNRIGQDVLARVVAGTGSALVAGFVVAIGAGVIGAVLGALAGMRGGRTDAVVLMFAGIFDALPVYLVAGSAAYASGGSWAALLLVLLASFWTTTARLVRADVLRLRDLPFVAAAKSSGVAPRVILRRHLLPHCTPLILAQGAITFVAAVKTEAILAFLGLGAQSGVSWGGMLAQAAQEVGGGHFQNFFAASAALVGLVLSVNVLADRLQASLDPHTHTRTGAADGDVPG